MSAQKKKLSKELPVVNSSLFRVKFNSQVKKNPILSVSGQVPLYKGVIEWALRKVFSTYEVQTSFSGNTSLTVMLIKSRVIRQVVLSVSSLFLHPQ